MTVIAGIWNFDSREGIAHDCERMLAAQYLYGLDGERRWVNASIALGRRITKLVPEDDYDAQPLQSTEGSLVLVADLRLDNRAELAAELNIAARARTMSDAALLLAAFER